MNSKIIIFSILLVSIMNTEARAAIKGRLEQHKSAIETDEKTINWGLGFGNREKALRNLRDSNREHQARLEEIDRELGALLITHEKVVFENSFLTEQLKLKDKQLTEVSQQNAKLSAEVAVLEERLRQCQENPNPKEFLCTIEVFGHKFIGVAADKEIAKAKALVECGKKFDMEWQCRGVTAVCVP